MIAVVVGVNRDGGVSVITTGSIKGSKGTMGNKAIE